MEYEKRSTVQYKHLINLQPFSNKSPGKCRLTELPLREKEIVVQPQTT